MRPKAKSCQVGLDVRLIGTHTLKIRCVCTDENAVSEAHNPLKAKHARSFSYDCVINTTTLILVSSRTCPPAKRQYANLLTKDLQAVRERASLLF
jgi:hypothetical protein